MLKISYANVCSHKYAQTGGVMERLVPLNLPLLLLYVALVIGATIDDKLFVLYWSEPRYC